jgi:hypothetical protein
MDDADTNDDEDQQHGEQEIISTAAAKQRRLLKLISVLEKKAKFSLRTRNKTDELVENFLQELGDDIHDMLCANNTEAENYSGLDSDRDTEAEVEAIVRVFPEVLTRRKYDDENFYYPIQLLTFALDEDGDWQCNEKSVSFIPILARLAIEFGLFEEDKRGGLLCEDGKINVLQDLMLSDGQTELPNQEHNEYLDTKQLQVLIQLRKLGYVKKEDIQRNGLLHRLCRNDYFAEKRFRFLAEWDPSALTQTYHDGQLPIHCAAEISSIQGFRSVFQAGIHYYPKKKGISLLFRKDDHDKTPFQYACRNFGYQTVIKVIEETLADHYHLNDDSDDDANGTYNIVDALITACIDEHIHLDCVYFLLRREPDVLQKILSLSSLSLSSSPQAATPSSVSDPNGNIIDHSKKVRKRKRG